MSIYAFQLFKALIFPTLTVVNVVRKTEIHDFISSPATELRKKNRSNICFIISFLTLKLPEGEFVCNKEKNTSSSVNWLILYLNIFQAQSRNKYLLPKSPQKASFMFVSLKYELTQRNLNLYIKLACTDFFSLPVRCFPEFSELCQIK